VQRSNPAFLDASVQRGVTLYSLGRTSEAVAQWSDVLERDPGRADARMYQRLVSRAAEELDPALSQDEVVEADDSEEPT
jgi:hypothetical protein